MLLNSTFLVSIILLSYVSSARIKSSIRGEEEDYSEKD